MVVRLTLIVAIFVGFQATAALADMKAIKDKGVIRHLGVRYARFVSGSGDGLSTDLIKGFADDLGVRYEYVETTWQSVIEDLTGKMYRITNGNVEITGGCPIKGDVIANGLTILPWRKELLDFSTPTFPSGVWLIARADSPLQPIRPSRSMPDDIEMVKSLLGGVSVLCMPGTCLDPALYQLEKTGAEWIPLNLKMNEFAPAVINREAESCLLDVADAMIALEKWPGQLKIIGPVTAAQKMGCGFRKSDADLRERFNMYLQTIRSDGRYMQLVQHYYPGVDGYFPEFFDRYGRQD
ncbi:transporter substrate-binding domain-containing protein [Desulfosarcina ovata]|nr:transporter substrate-binding domain-containing protein [Desulfosarcina ovata]